MDNEKGLLNIDLNTSPSFDVSNSLQAKSSPQHSNATPAKPPSAEQPASKVFQKQIKRETPSWLEGGNNEISQRELIQRQMEAKRQEEPGDGSSSTPVMILGDSFGSEQEEEKGLSIKDRMRKTAVAVTGSAIVASGTVMLVTPAHPFGHSVQLAGLGVLATEFERPKKLKARASDLVKRISGKSASASEGSNDGSKKSEPLPLGPSPLQDTSELQRSLASSSYVSPFRKTSVPPNATDAKQNGKAAKKTDKKSKEKPTLNRQGSTSLSEVTPINIIKSKKKTTKPKVQKSISESKLKRQGSTSLSGGL